MAITLTPEQKAQLQREESLVLPLAGADGAESAQFHDPKTGQEFVNLPVDPYHLTRYLRRGWMMGPASAELRAKWAAGESERTAADDSRVAEFATSAEHQESEKARFSDAVSAAVAQVLEKLGVDPNGKAHAQEAKSDETPEGDQEEVEPVQLDFFQTVDAPAESETKLNVSQASRPDLHLVE